MGHPRESHRPLFNVLHAMLLPQILTVNPMAKHRHRRHKRRHHARIATNPHRKHHRFKNRFRKHRRRVTNPLSLPRMGGLEHEIVPAVVGGLGAIGVDIGLAYASPYLPTFLQSGWGRIGAQVIAAVGLGYGAGAMIDRKTGTAVMAGALTITAYSALRQVLAPTLGANIKGLSGLADFSDYSPMWSGYSAAGSNMGAYMRNPRMGAYMNPGQPVQPVGVGMGRLGRLGYTPGRYMNPAARLSAYMPQGAYMQSTLGGYDSESM